MKISVEFPSVAYREGPAQVARLAQAVEEIGYDDLAVFDHVVMAYELEGRHRPRYPAQMPVLEALVMLGFVAAVTSRVSLSTEVLVLPQRQAAGSVQCELAEFRIAEGQPDADEGTLAGLPPGVREQWRESLAQRPPGRLRFLYLENRVYSRAWETVGIRFWDGMGNAFGTGGNQGR